MSKEKYYITSAISYPNGVPHIGHAYEFVCCDAIARFNRLNGADTRFLLGTDVHGQKMLQTARDQGITPKELADKNSDVFQAMTDKLNVSYDRFIRTSDEDHHTSCQALWKKMEANGDIYKDSYSGWYSVRDEAYYDEDETTVNDDDVRLGGQGTPVEWMDEESYFFKLSAYEDKLLALYEEHADFIAPQSRKNEIVSFVKGGLKDLSISRTTFDWGIKVPGDEKHVMYVWVDALTNYITGLGYPDEDNDLWSYWPADIHVIGKDITRFHAVYWPAFLMSVVNHTNADLANNFGNLAQRSLSMIAKNCEGKVPTHGEPTAEDKALLDLVYGLREKCQAHMVKYEIHSYAEEIWKVLGEANKYVDEQAPWGLKKTDPERIGTVLWTVTETVRNVAIIAQPIMPDSCNKMLNLLASAEDARNFDKLGADHALQSGVELPKPEGVFPRFVEKEA